MSNKRKQDEAAGPSAEELALQELVFGRGGGVGGSGKRGDARKSAAVGDEGGDEVEFRLDRKGSRAPVVAAAAWQDDDDGEVTVDLMATDRLKKLNKDAKKQKKKHVSGSELTSLLQERFQTRQLDWAQVDNGVGGGAGGGGEEGEGEEEVVVDDPYMAILRQEGSMVEGGKGGRSGVGSGSSGGGPLPPTKLNILRLVDANMAEPSKDRITSVAFHSSNSLLMAGGEDRHLRFFRVDGKTNDKVLTAKFADMAITGAAFLGDSAEVVVGGRKPFFYGYDTESGRVSKFPGLMGKGLKSHEHLSVSPSGSRMAFLGASGYVHIVCGKQKTWVMDIKMNSGARSAAFIGNDSMVTSGVDADVYLWDLRMQGRCVARFKHEDGTCTSALAAVSASSTAPQYVAVGAESGAVSLFPGTPVAAAAAAVKSFLHLTTQVTSLAFHPSAEILAMASDQKTDSLRLLHVPSGTVFGNWPTVNTPLRKVQAIGFSPNGAHMAVGNDRGKVLLYRLAHYS